MPKSMNRLFANLETLFREGHAVITQKLDHIITHMHQMKEDFRMERDEITRLVASVASNTNATKAVTDTLTALVASNTELAKELQDAIAAGGSDVSADIKAAADAIDANNATMQAAIPQLAKAATDNTPAAGKGN